MTVCTRKRYKYLHGVFLHLPRLGDSGCLLSEYIHTWMVSNILKNETVHLRRDGQKVAVALSVVCFLMVKRIIWELSTQV